MDVCYELIVPILLFIHLCHSHHVTLQLLLCHGNKPFQLGNIVFCPLDPNLTLQLFIATAVQLLLKPPLLSHLISKHDGEFFLLLLSCFSPSLLFPPNHIPLNMNSTPLLEALMYVQWLFYFLDWFVLGNWILL